MSFDEIQLPLRVGFGSTGGTMFSTEIITIDSGYERRNQNWSQARRRYDATTGLRTASDAATLIGFFHARAGRARGFRIKDWMDFTSKTDGISAEAYTDQNIGTGTGAQLTFQLRKQYVSGSITHNRTITKPVTGTVLIGVNGVLQTSGWSVDTATGIVTFSAAPTNGHAVTAGFQFDVPVRFDTDTLTLSTANFQLQNSEIPLVEIRI